MAVNNTIREMSNIPSSVAGSDKSDFLGELDKTVSQTNSY